MIKRIVSFVSILVLSIGSFFAFFSPKKNEVAYADEYNVLPQVFVCVNDEVSGFYHMFTVRFSSNLSSFASGSFSIAGGIEKFIQIYRASYQFSRGDWYTVTFSDFFNESSFVVQYFCDVNFAFNNVVRIDFFGVSSSSPRPRNVVRYMDANGNRFQFDFWCYSLSNSEYIPGLLYPSDILSLYTSPVDNSTATWQVAYQSGYVDGVQVGQSSGYSDGYNVGYSAGDAAGYQRGVDASNQYSFGNLLFAVVDTPVVIFRSLFDFNVLGVNLQGFFFSLLTVAVVIAVVRFILAR